MKPLFLGGFVDFYYCITAGIPSGNNFYKIQPYQRFGNLPKFCGIMIKSENYCSKERHIIDFSVTITTKIQSKVKRDIALL